MEGLVGIKNLFLVILPTIAMCDRNDIVGLVDVRVFGNPAIFIYDRYPGGMGFAERGFSDFSRMLSMAKKLIEECECESGCPACVGAVDPAHAFFKDMDEKGGWILPNKKSARKILDMLMEIGATPW
jgi:DEAD/DEAH box helicase domain-containing protein